MNEYWGADVDPSAQGRIKGARPIAVLDIGSNSVRLVVYERHARSLTTLYNEKTSCALGRGVAATGRLADANVAQALSAIQRFALVARLMRVGATHVLATSDVREASNSAGFVAAVERSMGAPVRVLSGPEEAHFAAMGVVSGMPHFSGIVGDQGGGSLELSPISAGRDGQGETHELGVVRLQDDSGGSASKAASLARARLKKSGVIGAGDFATFCAVGGTWRSLAKVHQVLRRYPLHMVQDYAVKAADLAKLCDEIVGAAADGKTFPGAESISASRRELVPYGAAVMGEVIRAGNFKTVVFSALGVREGFLHALLSPEDQALDPLVEAASEVSVLRSRSPAHAQDLIAFTDRCFAALDLVETIAEKRLRRVACLLSDIGWRGHPDYRGEQSVDMIAYSALTGVDHPGRAFLAETLAVRYMGLKYKSSNQPLIDLAGPAYASRARLLGAVFRVAYPLSAAMPGVLSRTAFTQAEGKLVLQLPSELEFLGTDHLQGRLDQLAGVAGVKGGSRIVVRP